MIVAAVDAVRTIRRAPDALFIFAVAHFISYFCAVSIFLSAERLPPWSLAPLGFNLVSLTYETALLGTLQF